MRKLLTILLLFFCLYGQAQFVGAGAINQQSSRVVTITGCPEATAAIANLATLPPQATQDNLTDLVCGCVDDGNWSLIRYIILAAMDTQANSLSDLINGTDAMFIGTTPPTFTAYVKWTGSSAINGGAIDTNWNPATVGVGDNDASYSVYVNGIGGGGTSNHDYVGGRNAYKLILQDNQSTTDIKWRVHSTAAGALDTYTAAGMAVDTYYTIERSGATSQDLLIDGSSVHATTRSFFGVPSVDIYGLAINNNGSISDEAQSPSSAAAFVFGTSGIDHIKMNTRIETWITAQAP